MPSNLAYTSASELAMRIRHGDLSPETVVDACLDRINERNEDLIAFKAGVRNTMGSKVFEEFVPEQSATYVERLEQAGAIIVGKTNTPEFGHEATTDNLLFGPTRTPYDLNRNAGGSSGGGGAAVADGLVPMAQGSDAGGSIRVPASFCGVYGFKATFGRVAEASRPDAFLSHTPFTHAGPITRTVADAALMLDGMCGPHPRDPLCCKRGVRTGQSMA